MTIEQQVNDLEATPTSKLTSATKVVCLTPIRNEMWILPQFLEAVKTWADHLVVVDHSSNDGSYEMVADCDFAHVVRYSKPTFDEPTRRKMLFDEARKIEGRKLLVVIDADEVINADGLDSGEWQQMLDSPEGTVFSIMRYGLGPNASVQWEEGRFAFALIDDGTEFDTSPIHGPRVPTRRDAPVVDLNEVKMLHYQFMDWERMRSKHRWYECWESIQDPNKRAVTSFRQYHRTEGLNFKRLPKPPDEWFSGYEQHGLTMRSVQSNPPYWWDAEVLEMLLQHGTKRFRKLDVWDADWYEIASQLDVDTKEVDLNDPRSVFDRIAHRILHDTQRWHNKFAVRAMQQFLRIAGW